MGNNHEKWYDQSKRKVLVMAFDDKYIDLIAKTLSKIKISVNDSIGFTNDNIYYNNLSLKLYYLTTINRHLWKHHLPGTQGIIMVFSFLSKVDDGLIYEAMNVICDSNIKEIPIFVCVDCKNKDDYIIEKLRKEINNSKEISNENIIFQEIDFDNNINQIKFGFDWLCETMKPLK
jgi:hypothetical protein